MDGALSWRDYEDLPVSVIDRIIERAKVEKEEREAEDARRKALERMKGGGM